MVFFAGHGSASWRSPLADSDQVTVSRWMAPVPHRDLSHLTTTVAGDVVVYGVVGWANRVCTTAPPVRVAPTKHGAYVDPPLVSQAPIESSTSAPAPRGSRTMAHTGAELVAVAQSASPPMPCWKPVPPGAVRASDTTSKRRSFAGVAFGRYETPEATVEDFLPATATVRTTRLAAPVMLVSSA